jgi:hypothetical protein
VLLSHAGYRAAVQKQVQNAVVAIVNGDGERCVVAKQPSVRIGPSREKMLDISPAVLCYCL